MDGLKKLHEAAEQRQEEYRQLVEAIANGDDYDSDKALNTLQAVNLSLEDLQADARRLSERRNLEKELDEVQQQLQEVESVEAKAAELREKKKDVVKPIDAELSKLQSIIQSGVTLKSRVTSIKIRLQQIENQQKRDADVASGRKPKFVGLDEGWKKGD